MSKSVVPADLMVKLLQRRRVVQHIEHLDLGPCWEYTGALDEDGYGRISIQGRMLIVSRVAGWLWNGWQLFSPTKMACHHCDNPICFNPRHLFEDDAKGNAQDAVKKGRWVSGSKNGYAKLDETKTAEILDLLAAGISQREVAIRYHVSQSTVARIALGRTWRHVTRPMRITHD